MNHLETTLIIIRPLEFISDSQKQKQEQQQQEQQEQQLEKVEDKLRRTTSWRFCLLCFRSRSSHCLSLCQSVPLSLSFFPYLSISLCILHSHLVGIAKLPRYVLLTDSDDGRARRFLFLTPLLPPPPPKTTTTSP